MPEPDLLQIFARPVHDAGIPYLVAGSVGAMFYAEPRLTLDIDLAVSIPNARLPALAGLFPEASFYVPPLEVLHGENLRECRGHFNVIHLDSGLKADFYPSQSDPFYGWASQHRRVVRYTHGEVFFAPPEYVIVWKIAYFAEGGGEKHVRDIRRMLELSGSEVDRAVLEKELSRRNLLSFFQTITQA